MLLVRVHVERLDDHEDLARRGDLRHLIDRAAHDDEPRHPAADLHVGRPVLVRMVPVQPAGMVVRDRKVVEKARPRQIAIIIAAGSLVPSGAKRCGIVWMPCTCKLVVLNPCGLFIGSILCDGVFAGRKSRVHRLHRVLDLRYRHAPLRSLRRRIGRQPVDDPELKVSPGRVSIVGPTVRPLYVRVRSLYPLMLVSAYCVCDFVNGRRRVRNQSRACTSRRTRVGSQSHAGRSYRDTGNDKATSVHLFPFMKSVAG